MKKILAALILSSFLFFPMMGLANDIWEELDKDGEVVGMEPPETVPDIPATAVLPLVKKIGDWIFSVLMVVAAIMLIVAGFFFVTASGNPMTLQKAREMVIYALVGAALALLAKGLVALVRGIIGG